MGASSLNQAISAYNTAQKWVKAIDRAKHDQPCGRDAGETFDEDRNHCRQVVESRENDGNGAVALPLQDYDEGTRAAVDAYLNLNQMVCSICGCEQNVGTIRLITKTGFSKAKCRNKECGEVQLSSIWKCRCKMPWVRCPRHVHSAEKRAMRKPKAVPTRKAQRQSIYGSDRPPPSEKVDRSRHCDRGLYSHSKKRWREVDETTSSEEFGIVAMDVHYPYSYASSTLDMSCNQPMGPQSQDMMRTTLHALWVLPPSPQVYILLLQALQISAQLVHPPLLLQAWVMSSTVKQ